LADDAAAQQKPLKEQLVGTWTIVSADNTRPDGTRLQLFGPNPKGILVLDGNGRTAFMLMSSGRPKFASNNRNTGTPEENKATVQGTIAFFGTWSVNEADKTIITRIEASTFPNQEGQDQKRIVTSVTADELRTSTRRRRPATKLKQFGSESSRHRATEGLAAIARVSSEDSGPLQVSGLVIMGSQRVCFMMSGVGSGHTRRAYLLRFCAKRGS
jgi:hypothetical protein